MPNPRGIFECPETPLTVSPTSLYNNTQPYRSYFGKFSCPETGPMTVSLPVNQGTPEVPKYSGMLIDENTQTSFSRNGVVYNQNETRLYIPGLHNHLGGVGNAELTIFFRSLTMDIYCICLPLFYNETTGSVYFSQLNKTFNSGLANRQSLGTVFPYSESDAIEYRGADIRNRINTKSNPEGTCYARDGNLINNIVPFPVTYMLMNTPGTIKSTDLQRLSNLFNFVRILPSITGPIRTTITPSFAGPLASVNITNSTIFTKPQSPIRLCPSIRFVGKTIGPVVPKVPALKCYQVDPTKDIGEGGIINLEKAKDNVVNLNDEAEKMHVL